MSLGDLRNALVTVHKHLVDVARADYTRDHGGAPTPQVLLHHLTTDEAFAWLRPLSALIVAADELIDDESPDPAAVSALRREIDALVRGDNAFTAKYRPAMQDPTQMDLVVAHGALVRALAAPTRP